MSTLLAHALSLEMFPPEIIQEDQTIVPRRRSLPIDDEWEDDFRVIPPEIESLILTDGLTDRQKKVVKLHLGGVSVRVIAQMIRKEDIHRLSEDDIELCLACAFDIMREREEKKSLSYRAAA